MATLPDPHVPRASFGRRLEPPGDLVLHGAGQDPAAFRDYFQAVGDHKPALSMTYLDLRADIAAHFRQLGAELEDYHPYWLIPQIGLMMTAGADDTHHPEGHYEHDVAAGHHDAAIDALCDGLRGLNRPAYLRIGFEFNGPWFGYRPEPYRAAWQRIVTAIRRQPDLVDHVAAVWCYCPLPSSREQAGGIDRDYLAYYPGDDWVDWWAIDLFSPGDFTLDNTRWFLADAEWAGYPVMIGESTPRRVGGVQAGVAAWAAWFAPYFAFIRQHRTIKAFCYINWDWTAYPVWHDWGDARIQANALILARYCGELADPLFGHASIGES